MTASKIFLLFCLSFIFGIFLSSFFSVSLPVLLAILILGIIFISVFWKYKKLAVMGFCILFLVLGIWRYQQVEIRRGKSRQGTLSQQDLTSEIRNYNDGGEVVILTGIVSAEPDIREKSLKLVIKPEKIDGKILVTTARYPEYQYGDRLKIIGKLESPKELEDFNYPDYLAKDGIYSVSYWPKIELIERKQGNFFYAAIFQLKNKLRESINQNLSPPQSSILAAMILGDKRQISKDWKEKLNITGVRHITAISGLHITVLTVILMNFLIWLGFWRQQAFYFTIILITLFIVMTGLQASAIRAGIMGGFFLLAQYLGRMNVSSRAIVFTGAVMLFQNPLLLKFDVGFQLSFLAMLGIIYLLDIFRDWLKFLPWENPKNILAMTFSAYLFSLPILIYNFGYISFIGPLTNLLIVPFLYWIMLFGFISVLAGMLSSVLGWFFSFPSWFLLTYLTKIVDWFSKVPLAFLTIKNIHWIWLLIFYLILGIIVWRLQEREKLKFLNY